MDDANNHGEVCNSSFLGNIIYIYIYIGQEDADTPVNICNPLEQLGSAAVPIMHPPKALVISGLRSPSAKVCNVL